jgi:predicted Fe-Mo cluster-binding NifX family protein
MILCIPVTSEGLTAPGWGRAHRVAVASTSGGDITDWRELDVAWDTLHDEGTEGAHHARVARFLVDEHVDVVVAEHMGAGMVRMLSTMGIPVAQAAAGDARVAVLAAARTVA